VLAQPIGSRPDIRDFFYTKPHDGLGRMSSRRPEITIEMVDKFSDADVPAPTLTSVLTVTRDFVAAIGQTLRN